MSKTTTRPRSKSLLKTPKQRFECDTCNRVFKKQGKLERHVKEIHLMDFESFDCKECSKSFKRKEHYKRHMKATHFGDKYSCPLCEVTYVEVSRIKTHLKKVHKLDTCQHCGHFEKELEGHTCTQGGLTKVKLHGRSKKQTGVLYSCKSCKLTFLTIELLENHHASKIHDQKNKENSRNFKKDTNKIEIKKRRNVS